MVINATDPLVLLSCTSSPRSRGPGRTVEQPVECSEVAGSYMIHMGLGLELRDMVFVSNSTVSPIPRNYRSQNQCGSGSGPPHSQICTIFASCSQNSRLCQLEVLFPTKAELYQGTR